MAASLLLWGFIMQGSTHQRPPEDATHRPGGRPWAMKVEHKGPRATWSRAEGSWADAGQTFVEESRDVYRAGDENLHLQGCCWAGLPTCMLPGAGPACWGWTLLPRQYEKLCQSPCPGWGSTTPITDTGLTRGPTRAPLRPQKPSPRPQDQPS